MKNKRTIVISICVILCFIIVFLVLLGLKELFTFEWLFSAITKNIISELGYNIWLARALAAIFALLLTFAIFLILTWGKGAKIKRSYGLILLSFSIIGYSVFIYFSSKDNQFKSDGTYSKCYSRGIDGKIEFVSCNWKVHPNYGTPVLPVTPEIMQEIQIQKYGVPESNTLTVTRETRFFSFDGKPLIWYYQHADGKTEFFDKPGRHPQLNVVLSEVNSEIVKQYLQYKDRGEKDKFIVNSDSLQELADDIDSWKVKQ
ncbi:conserved membrane hypothetical protein [Candidatus Magnetomoraceae bacterium gMMP-15]